MNIFQPFDKLQYILPIFFQIEFHLKQYKSSLRITLEKHSLVCNSFLVTLFIFIFVIMTQ